MELKDKLLAITELPAELQEAALNDLAAYYSKDEFKSSFGSIVKDCAQETLELKNNFIKEQLDEIAPIISFSYIAKNYFKKSKGWLSVKIKNGSFSESELEVLNSAIQDMSVKIAACKLGSIR